MLHQIQKLVRWTDSAIAGASLTIRRENNGLLVFLFHSIFRTDAEAATGAVDPLERTTVQSLRALIEYFHRENYRFISQADLLGGLDDGRACAMLTFDDGYANNALAAPLLEEMRVPATMFISTAHVQDAKSFWWDVLYRERIERGAANDNIYREAVTLKQFTTEQIEQNLIEQFGADSLQPRGDLDRALTVAELRELAKHPLITIGNHTHNHAILTNYSDDEAARQIEGAQQWLTDTLGQRPLAIAYPNGAHNDAIVEASKRAGLSLGFTVRPLKNSLPFSSASDRSFRLSRFCPNGNAPMKPQCRAFRSDLQLYSTFRDAYLKYSRGQVAQ